MLHYRMNKIIKLLENDGFQTACRLYERSSKYRKAFLALAEQDIIDIVYDEENDRLINCGLRCGKAALYSLSRHDVWANRIVGFIAGVVTGVVAPIFIQMLS